MLRGILKTRSVDINNFQRFIDPFFLANLFFWLSNDRGFSINLNYFLVLGLNYLILNYYNLYKSYRIKNLINIIPDIFFISCTISFTSIILKTRNISFEDYKLISFFTLCFSFLFFHHYVLRKFLRILRSHGFNLREIVFFGNSESFSNFKKQIKDYPWIGYRIIFWFSPNKEDYKIDEFHCSGGLEDLTNVVKTKKIEKLFFSHEDSDSISLNKLLDAFGDLCLSVSYIINWNAVSISLKKEFVGDLISLNIWNPGNSILNEKIKRIFDLLVSIILLIFLFPLFLLIALIIRLSSKGPIFFRQTRYGINGKLFKMYKFRTMFVSNSKDERIIQAKRNDKRITKVGKFLRKYSLDEIPQLINVIFGDMSLVGPRPHAEEHNQFYRKLITGYMQRHSKLPGMTGLAQINGARGETTDIELMKKRIKYDLDYNNNWNLGKDFFILIKTFFIVLGGKSY